jgi:hypothetical protein
LLLQGRAQLSRPCLHLFEKPDVLDGNNSLVGEGMDKIDLLRCKWLHFSACQREYASYFAVPQQWDPKQ